MVFAAGEDTGVAEGFGVGEGAGQADLVQVSLAISTPLYLTI